MTSLYYDNIIASAGTLPPPRPIPQASKNSKNKNKNKQKQPEKLLFHFPLNKIHEYGNVGSLNTERILSDNELSCILKLRDTDPEIYRNYYYHRDLNLLGGYNLYDIITVENRQMAIHILNILQKLDVRKLFVHGKNKFKYDEPLVCYLCGIMNRSCPEILNMLEIDCPANMLQYISIDIDVCDPEEMEQLMANMDPEHIRRTMISQMIKVVRFDDAWKSLFWGILCIQPGMDNFFRRMLIKYLKNEEEVVKLEEDEDVKFTRIMNELHEDMVKLKINPASKSDDKKQEVLSKTTQKGLNSKGKSPSKANIGPQLLLTSAPQKTPPISVKLDFRQPQRFKMYKLKHSLFLPIAQEFLLDSSDDEFLEDQNSNSNSNSDTDSDCSESEFEQVPSDSYSNSQNQFELLTTSSSSSGNNNNNNNDDTRNDIAASASSECEMGMTEQEYSEFVYDELDNDPNFIDLVELLADLFPVYAKTYLKFRLKFADSVEELMEELFIETESQDLLEREVEMLSLQQPEPIYDDKVYQLREMFPNIDNVTIDRKLKENNNNIEDTATTLLALPVTEFLSVGPQNKFTANEWNQVSGLVTRISNFLGINEDNFVLDSSDIVHYVRKSGCNYYDALVGIIMNCRPRVLQTIRRHQVGGRVQGRGGASSSARKGRTVKTITRLVKSNYRYNPISEEAKELRDLVPSNEQLKVVNNTLLINALEFFQGNVFKVIELVSELSSNQTTQHTMRAAKLSKQQPILRFTPKVENDPYILIEKKFTNYSNTRSSKMHKNSSGVSNNMEKDRFYEYIVSGHIDLHGLRLTEAMRLTKLVLHHWWDEEMKNREVVGRMDKFGDNASIGSIKVITGRGIHSANGVSILKRYVKEHLVKNRYVFNEEIGSFEVTGKRRR